MAPFDIFANRLADDEIRLRESELESGRRADRALRVVRRKCNAVRLGERAYLAGRGQPAAMRDVRLRNLAAAGGKQVAELAEVREPLAGCNGSRDGGVDARQVGDVLRPARLFQEIQPVRFERLRKLHAHGRRRPRMTVNHDVNIRPDRRAHALDRGRRRAHGREAFERHGRGHRHGFECRIAALDGLPCKIGKAIGVGDVGFVKILHPSTAQVAVQTDVVAHSAAPKLVTGNVQDLAGDVPQGDINPRHRGRADNAAAVPKMLSKHHLPQMLDAPRIFPHDERRQILEGADHAARVPLEGSLAPAKQPRLIGFHFDEDPVAHARVADDRFDCGDLHDFNVRALAGASWLETG